MDRITIVSADSHGGLRPEDYRPYFDPEYRDYADELRAEQDAWFEVIAPIVKPFPDEVLEVIDPHDMIRSGAYSAAWDVDKRLEVFDAEGIAAAVVIYSSQEAICPFFSSKNIARPADVRAAGARAYNRWLADFCQAGKGRLAGLMGAIPFPDIEALVEQLRWGKDAGLAGIILPETAGHDLPALHDPFWEPLWATCAELGFALTIHAGHGMAHGEFTRLLAETVKAATKPDGSYNAMMADRDSDDLGSKVFKIGMGPIRPLWQLIWSGVFDRHPTLQVVFTEVGVDWIPGTLQALDAIHEAGDSTLKMRPSEYWARNGAVGASSLRPNSLGLRHEIGVGRMLFGTDFPHPEGTFPNTLDWIRETFRGVSEEEARKILGDNAIDVYGLDRAHIESVAARIGPTPGSVLGPGHSVDPRIVEHWNVRSGYGKALDLVDPAEVEGFARADLREARLPDLAATR